MDNSNRRSVGIRLLVIAGVLASTGSALAQRHDGRRGPRRTSSEAQTAGKTQQDIEKQVKAMGPWDEHQQVVSEATDNVFRQQGWTSEPDLFARDVLRDVERIPPWEYQRREETFMNRLQVRYALTEDQKAQVSRGMRRESLKVMIKHFRTMAPMAMEMMRVRKNNEPFTPEMVQRWSESLDPVMADAKEALLRVAKKLEVSMTPEQRARLKSDLKATLKRHNDVVKMVDQWKQGKWTPESWGLQDDPAHRRQMEAVARARTDREVEDETRGAQRPSTEWATSTNESTWKKYVRLFCIRHHCDENQTEKSYAILRDVERKARNHRAARKNDIARLEAAIERSEKGERRTRLHADLERTLGPIREGFNELCKRLDGILTTRQRALARNTPAGTRPGR